MNINYNHLIYFKHLAESLSFSRTAEHFKIAQPAVSKAIRNLEASLGYDLFNRNNKVVALSKEGQKLYGEIVGPLNTITGALDKSGESNEISGEIRLGCLREYGEYKVSKLISDFIKKYQKVRVKLVFDGDYELLKLLKEGKLDLMIGVSSVDQENISSFKLVSQKSYLLTSTKSKKETLKKLSQFRFIKYRDNDPLIKSYVEKYYPKISRAKIENVMTVNSHQSMIDALINLPNTYAVLPSMSRPIDLALKQKKLRIVDSKSLKSDLFLTHWHQNFKDELFQRFKAYLISHLKM